MAKKTCVFLVFALSAFLVCAQDGKNGFIEGDGWAYLISAPKGWVWDGVSLRYQGIQGLFYKEGTMFSPSKLHIYISPAMKKKGEPATLDEFIKTDEAAFMKSGDGNRVSDLEPYSSGLDYKFILKDFDDKGEAYYQTIAYYEGDTAFFLFILFCRSSAERDRERSSFFELLDSFTYLHKE
jgi:hypothetical protein